jgi:hypothetical protein
MSWRSIRRRLERLESCAIRVYPNETPQQRFIRLYGLESLVRPATDEARAALEELLRQLELDYDPPDKIERLLARKIAEVRGQPDPFCTDGMSEAERRAWDWADYREKVRRGEEEGQQEGRPQYGLRELRASDTMSTRNREHEQGRVA